MKLQGKGSLVASILTCSAQVSLNVHKAFFPFLKNSFLRYISWTKSSTVWLVHPLTPFSAGKHAPGNKLAWIWDWILYFPFISKGFQDRNTFKFTNFIFPFAFTLWKPLLTFSPFNVPFFSVLTERCWRITHPRAIPSPEFSKWTSDSELFHFLTSNTKTVMTNSQQWHWKPGTWWIWFYTQSKRPPLKNVVENDFLSAFHDASSRAGTWDQFFWINPLLLLLGALHSKTSNLNF